MGRYTNGRVYDYTQNFVNIDNLVDVLTTVQTELGKKPTFELKDEYKKSGKEETAKPQEKSCPSCSMKSSGFLDALRLDSFDDDDDDDDFYMCEYCSALGYSKKYDQSVCDGCTTCLSCNQYDTECSGCSYSCHRDGEYYSTKLSEDELLIESDLEIFRTLDETDNERMISKHFSINR